MYTVEHIGIAVRSLAESDSLYERLLGIGPYKHEDVPEQKVRTSFFKAGNVKIELLQALDSESPIQRFLDKKGEGIHHIAFMVEDILLEMKRLKEEGFELLQDEPSIGADNMRVCFIHPRSVNGVLVELCQPIDRQDLHS